MFNNFKLWKSPNVWSTKNTFYFFGYGFKNNYFPEIFSNMLEFGFHSGLYTIGGSVRDMCIDIYFI